MIQVAFRNRFFDQTQLQQFVTGEETTYVKNNKAFVSIAKLDTRALRQNKLSELEQTLGKYGYVATRTDDDFSIAELTTKPIQFYVDDALTAFEVIEQRISEGVLTCVGEKERTTWYGAKKVVPLFKRALFATACGSFETDIDDLKKLQPCLTAFSQLGYSIELESETDRLKKEINDLRSRLSTSDVPYRDGI